MGHRGRTSRPPLDRLLAGQRGSRRRSAAGAPPAAACRSRAGSGPGDRNGRDPGAASAPRRPAPERRTLPLLPEAEARRGPTGRT